MSDLLFIQAFGRSRHVGLNLGVRNVMKWWEKITGHDVVCLTVVLVGVDCQPGTPYSQWNCLGSFGLT